MAKEEPTPEKSKKTSKRKAQEPGSATVRLPVKEAVKEADDKAKAKEQAKRDAEKKRQEESKRAPIFTLIAQIRARATKFSVPFPRELEKKMEESPSRGGVKHLWRDHVQKIAWEACLAGKPDPLPQNA